MSRGTPRRASQSVALPKKPLTPAQERMLARLRAACRAGAGRRPPYDDLLTELAFAARDRVRYFPRATNVEFEGLRIPIGSGAITVVALDPETFVPLVSALRNGRRGQQR